MKKSLVVHQLRRSLTVILMTFIVFGSPVIQAEEALTRAEAVEKAKKQAGGGKVLKVKPGPDGKGFQIKILKDGKVKTVVIEK